MNEDPLSRPSRGRKLVAVVHADMVGYSRLIGNDDAGTVKRLRTLRRALIDPTIRAHGGNVVSTAGDSLLIVFDSIEGAVRCAIDIQRHVPVYDGDQRADRAIRFRIGINIGDAISDGEDIHGDGVNVAARLQTECPVGGICVSRAVRDHVPGDLQNQFEGVGTLRLKNIPHPVDAFVFRLPAGAPAPDPSPPIPPDHGPTGAMDGPIRPAADRKGALAVTAFVALAVGAAIGVVVGGASIVETGLGWFTAAIAAAAAVAALGWIGLPGRAGGRAAPAGAPPFGEEGAPIRVFDKSNDFLATGDRFQFPSLLKETRREAWFAGTTFFISVGQFRALILGKLSDGVDVNFLILDPHGIAIDTMARLLGVTAEELKLDCMSGIRVLKRTLRDALSGKFPGALRVKLLDQPFQTRFYMFDPRSEGGFVYFVPQINGTNSQTVPGFLVGNARAAYASAYYSAVLEIWNDPAAVTLEEWSARNGDPD